MPYRCLSICNMNSGYTKSLNRQKSKMKLLGASINNSSLVGCMLKYFGNVTAYGTEAYDLDVTYDADSDYGIKILINCQNYLNMMTSSV